MKEDTYKSGRGRPPNVTPRDRIHLVVDRPVMLYWKLAFTDPITGRWKNGEFSNLVTRLLREEANRKGAKL